MAFTAELGIADSRLSNIALGIATLGSGPTLEQEATNTLTFVGTATRNSITLKLVNQSLVFAGVVDFDHITQKGAVSSFTFAQSTSFLLENIFNQPITQSIIFIGAAHAEIIINKTVPHALTFVQNAKATLILEREVTNTLIFTQRANLSHTLLATNTLVFAQNVLGDNSRSEPATNALVFAQSATGLRIPPNPANNVLTFVGIAISEKIINRTATNTLIFNQNAQKLSIFTREITQTLTFLPYYLQPLPLIFNDLPIINSVPQAGFYLKKFNQKNVIVLKSGARVIVLPAPQFDDTIENSDEVIIQRSMTNVVYTYVKRTQMQKLSYSFILGRPKSLELREFIEEKTGKIMELQNWHGERWIVNLLTNPVVFEAKNRRRNCDNERLDVSLEFEGVKVFGGSYADCIP